MALEDEVPAIVEARGRSAGVVGEDKIKILVGLGGGVVAQPSEGGDRPGGILDRVGALGDDLQRVAGAMRVFGWPSSTLARGTCMVIGPMPPWANAKEDDRAERINKRTEAGASQAGDSFRIGP